MSRILAAATLVVLVAAGCGGAARPRQVALRGVPSALDQDWEGQATAIAAASAAGNDCRAQALATALRTQVLQRQHSLPSRLRSPLVTGLDSLLSRTTCTHVPAETAPQPHGRKPPHEPHDHGHGQGHHGHGNDQGDQGGDG